MSKSETPEIQGTDCRNEHGTGVDRRRFVGLVGASLAAHWLMDPPTLGWSATVTPPAGTVLVPGYLRASHRAVVDETVLRDLSDPGLPPHDTLRRVIPMDVPLEFVSSIDIGEVPVKFDKQCARIHIHGVLPPLDFNLADDVEALHLEAEIALEAETTPARFYVWGLDKGPVENMSGPTRFDVPLGKEISLRLDTTFERTAVAVESGGRGIGRSGESSPRCTTVLTLRDRVGHPQLRPGVYCLPLSQKALDAFPLVANRDWLVPDWLPYLLFSVESRG